MKSLLESYLKQRKKGEGEISLEQKVNALLDALDGDDSKVKEINRRRKETKGKVRTFSTPN